MPVRQQPVNLMDVWTQFSLGNISKSEWFVNQQSNQQPKWYIDMWTFKSTYVKARQDWYVKSRYDFAKELESDWYQVEWLQEYKKSIWENSLQKKKKRSYFAAVGDILDRRYERTKNQLWRTVEASEKIWEARTPLEASIATEEMKRSAMISAGTLVWEPVWWLVDIGLLTLWRTVQALTPDVVEGYVVDKARDVWDLAKNRKFVQDAIWAISSWAESYEQYQKDYPEQAQLFDNIVNVTDLVWLWYVKSSTKSIVKETAQQAQQRFTQAIEISDISNAVRSQKEQMTDYLANKVGWLSKETTQAIRENPRYEKFETGELTRIDLWEEVVDTLQREKEEISELWAAYNEIRNKDIVVSIWDVWENVKTDVFDKYTISVMDDGTLDFSKSSFSKDISDQKAISDAWDIIQWNDVTANVWLNKRHALSKLSRFWTDVSGDWAAVVREIRNIFNQRLHAWIDWLEELDNIYWPMREKIDLLTKDYYKQWWQLKDSFYSTIASITNKGKELKFDRLKEVMPDIEAKAWALRAFEEVEKAIWAKTGVYDRIPLIWTAVWLWASLGSYIGPVGTFIWSLLWLRAWIKYTDVRTIVETLKKQGKKWKEVIEKIQTGKSVTTDEKIMIKNIAEDAGLVIDDVVDISWEAKEFKLSTDMYNKSFMQDDMFTTKTTNTPMQVRGTPWAVDNVAGKLDNIPDDLLQEARKYKSADEFVESQIKKWYRTAHQIDTRTSSPITDVWELKLSEFIDDFKNQYGYPALKSKDVEKLKKVMSDPNADITVYRASPKNELNSWDRVTIDKDYAEDIKKQNWGKVYTHKVKAKDLFYPKTLDWFRDLPSLNKRWALQYQDTQNVSQLRKIREQANNSLQ